MKLIVSLTSPFARKIRVILAEKGLPCDLQVDIPWLAETNVPDYNPLGKVPVLVDKNLSVHESLAICEYVAELAPEAKLWPEDRALRARGRAICAEMASSFGALRSEMSANIRGRSAVPRVPSAEAQRDIERVFDIWRASLATSPGAFLLGDFGIADAMYYPVLTRFRTYGVPLPAEVARWAASMEAHPSVVALVRQLQQDHVHMAVDWAAARGALAALADGSAAGGPGVLPGSYEEGAFTGVLRQPRSQADLVEHSLGGLRHDRIGLGAQGVDDGIALPLDELAVLLRHLQVGVGAEDLVAEVALEAVHDREHRDQRGAA